jgi:hypothetical protein
MVSRESRVAAVAVTLLAATALAAGCGSSAASATPSPVPPTPSATLKASLEPTAIPSAEAAIDAEAARIIEALGGQVPAGTTGEITYGDVVNGSPSVHVAMGDWQPAWDSAHVLHHVFWDQSAGGETPPPAGTLTEAEVRTKVETYTAALGLDIGPPPALAAEGEAWLADWPRIVDGIVAEDNGTRLWVNKDGTFLQYTFGWNDLAPKPAKPITEAQAIGVLDDCKVKAGSPAVCQAWLVWHLPASAALEDPLVLCWKVAPMNPVHGEWVVWVDAGSGEIVDVAAELD